MFGWLRRKAPGPLVGNEHTGELTLKHDVLYIDRVVGNWVYGCIPGMKCYFSAKVHAIPSLKRDDPLKERGINDGRISRLWISCNKKKIDPLVDFDLGKWVVSPVTALERTVLDVMLESWA